MTTSNNSDKIAASIADDILKIIDRLKGKRSIDVTLNYSQFEGLFLHLLLRRGSPSAHSADWEKKNFEKSGFSLDANTYVPKSGSPGIEMAIIIDPISENSVMSELHILLLDTIRHEIEHIRTVNLRNPSLRKEHGSSYRYFLLADEIPAAVAGLKLLARKKGISLIDAIRDYLQPFIDSGFMTNSQSAEVSRAWLNHAESI